MSRYLYERVDAILEPGMGHAFIRKRKALKPLNNIAYKVARVSYTLLVLSSLPRLVTVSTWIHKCKPCLVWCTCNFRQTRDSRTVRMACQLEFGG